MSSVSSLPHDQDQPVYSNQKSGSILRRIHSTEDPSKDASPEISRRNTIKKVVMAVSEEASVPPVPPLPSNAENGPKQSRFIEHDSGSRRGSLKPSSRESSIKKSQTFTQMTDNASEAQDRLTSLARGKQDCSTDAIPIFSHGSENDVREGGTSFRNDFGTGASSLKKRRESGKALSRKISKSSKAHSSHGSSMLGSVDLVHNILKHYQYMSGVISSSAVYKFIYQVIHSTRIQIYFSSFFHTLDLTVMVMILVFSNGFELPSISYYNLIHAVLGSLGKISLVAGTYASALIGKEYVAKALVKKGRGIPLSDVAVSKNNFLPAEGLTVRHMFIGSLFLLEAATWYFVLEMQFIPIPTSLGFKPCIPATYTSPPNFLTDVPQFLSGDASMGVVYNYGLPLADGLIGGWAAWPLDNPSSQFDVRGDGVVYTYSVTCGNLQVAPKMRNVSELTMSMSYANLWTNSYTAIISVQFPAGAHSWAQHLNQSVTQSCTMQYVLGSGSVKFTFYADEWHMVTGGQMDQIDISGYPLTQYMDPQVYFDDVARRIGSTTMHIEMVGWFVTAFTSCFNGTNYPPTQAGKTSSLFQWGVTDGLYDLNTTWIGISGAVGAIAHYITMQYNGSASAYCEYFGQQGSGTLAVPPLNRSIMLAAVIIGFICQMMQLLRWALTSGGGLLTDRVAVILNSPLLMLYYMRASITTLIPDIKDQNHSTRSIRNHMGKIFVRIGEDKRTRGDLVGTLMLAAPNMVVAMSDKRQYAEMTAEERKEINMTKCTQLIKKVPFLKYEGDSHRQQEYYDMIAQSLIERTFPPNTTVMKQGDIGNNMFFLLTGKVDISMNGEYVATLKEGTFFGELALVSQIPRTATITAKTPCCTYSLNATDLKNISDHFPEVKAKITAFAEQRMSLVQKEANSQAARSRMSSQPAEDRSRSPSISFPPSNTIAVPTSN